MEKKSLSCIVAGTVVDLYVGEHKQTKVTVVTKKEIISSWIWTEMVEAVKLAKGVACTLYFAENTSKTDGKTYNNCVLVSV